MGLREKPNVVILHGEHPQEKAAASIAKKLEKLEGVKLIRHNFWELVWKNFSFPNQKSKKEVDTFFKWVIGRYGFLHEYWLPWYYLFRDRLELLAIVKKPISERDSNELINLWSAYTRKVNIEIWDSIISAQEEKIAKEYETEIRLNFHDGSYTDKKKVEFRTHNKEIIDIIEGVLKPRFGDTTFLYYQKTPRAIFIEGPFTTMEFYQIHRILKTPPYFRFFRKLIEDYYRNSLGAHGFFAETVITKLTSHYENIMKVFVEEINRRRK